MKEPPLLVDGARVVEYAVFDRSMAPTGRMSVAVGGVPVDLNSVAGVLIAENLVEGGFFLLHCNERWDTLAAGHYNDQASARQAAERAYSELTASWTPFRDLSADEWAEIETTRAFLRQLAADYPNQ